MSYAPLLLTIPFALVLLALALPAAVTARRGWTGRLERRGRLGVHTPAALASDDAFALANRVAAPLVAGAAAAGVACAAIPMLLPVGLAGAMTVFALGLVGTVGQLMYASTIGERAARTVPLPARKPQGGGCCGGCGCGDGGCTAGAAGHAGGSIGNDVIPDLLPDAIAH